MGTKTMTQASGVRPKYISPGIVACWLHADSIVSALVELAGL